MPNFRTLIATLILTMFALTATGPAGAEISVGGGAGVGIGAPAPGGTGTTPLAAGDPAGGGIAAGAGGAGTGAAPPEGQPGEGHPAAPPPAGAGAGGPPPLTTQPPPLNQPPAAPTIKPHYVAVNGQATGPHDEVALRAMIARGELKRDTLVWAEGMTDWTAAGTVEALAPLLASLPPEVRFDPRPFMRGSWRGDRVRAELGGFAAPRGRGAAPHPADGKLRINGKMSGTSIYGQYIVLTISGEGTYKAEMQGSKQIVITPVVALTYSAPGGGGGVDQMTAPFVITILDNNTVADEQGYKSYRMQ